MAFNVNALGFGDNVVDRYEHIHTMYPGGNAVNFAVYAKKCGAARSAYMGIFGNDAAAEHVIASLEDEGIELDKCEQMIGENGAARVTVVDGDRVFLGSNEGGIRGDARYVLDRFDLSYMKQFDVVHSGNYCFTERELPKLKAAGVTVSFDFSDDSTDEYYEQIAPYVDFAFFSAADAASEDEIRERVARKERVLVTTLTKRMAEDLTDHLLDAGIKVNYLHSDTATMDRVEILRTLREGKIDVLVGINLLREGLDLPEVSLVAILDADKEGFLRNRRSLIQTIGRAARNADGEVIMYADVVTDSMKEAIEETGFEVGEVKKVFELFMSPGGVTEIVHFFIAEYSDAHRIHQGGGVEDEDIEVLEIPFVQALAMIRSGEIKDGKAVILLQYLQTTGLMDPSFERM